MSDDNLLHFEKLWEKAETLSSQTHKNATSLSIADELTIIIQDLKDNLDPLNDSMHIIDHTEELQRNTTIRLIGELLYIISAISVREDVDVYSALKEHMENLFK